MVVDHNLKGMQTAIVISLSVFFFIFAIGIAIISGGVYNGVVRTSDANFTNRTAISYLINQVRRCDTEDGIRVDTFGQSDAIFLTQAEGDSLYTTCLYLYDGQITELYYEEGFPLLPEDGVAILPANGLEISLDNDGKSIRFAVLDQEGASTTSVITPYCGVEG